MHNLLQTLEAGMKGKVLASTPASSPLLTIGHGKGKKSKVPPKQNWKGKAHVSSSSSDPNAKPSSNILHISDPKEVDCFYNNDKGH